MFTPFLVVGCQLSAFGGHLAVSGQVGLLRNPFGSQIRAFATLTLGC